MVSLEHYKCFCETPGLTRVKSRDGRGFLKCKQETCTLFIPEEKYPSLMVCYETKVNQCYKPNRFPLCHCNEMCSLWVSNSETNPGRGYFRCQENDEDQKCSYFKWSDKVQRTAKKRNCDDFASGSKVETQPVKKEKAKKAGSKTSKKVKQFVTSSEEEK